MQIREVFDRKRFVLLDGGMGTQLQTRGLQPGQKPELAALEMPDTLTAIHADYARAGADILLAFEPMEAVRALSKANADTIVITNTAPVVPFIPGGSAAYPPVDELLACLRAKVGRVIAFDARKESLEAGNPLGLNMVMLGALYGAADMPLTKESQMEAIRKNGKPAFVESNLNCFERGFKAASEETAKD